tara:strand:+ start:302 stop:1282 length:981 start_codon:yes stop_codon:yes gene_type:complete
VIKHLKLGLLSLLSLAGLYFAFKGEDLGQLALQLADVDFIFVTIACVFLLFSCIIRAFRWKLLLHPFDKVQLKNVYSATMIGYFGNAIFAFRLGELLKAYSVVKGTKIKTLQAFGTVIIERLLDIIALVIILIFLIPWFPFDDDYIRYGVISFMLISFLSFAILYVLIRFELVKNFENKKWLLSGFGLKLKIAIVHLFDGLNVINKNEAFYQILISSILLWGIYFIETIFLVKACGLNLEIIEIGILFVLGSIAFGIPALPGSAGTYDAGVKYSLIFVFNISSTEALNYAIISHSVAYFPLLIIGFIYFLAGNIRFNEIKKIKFNK